MTVYKICLLVIAMLMTACTSLPKGHAPWGQDTTLSPGWQRLKQATIKALKDPQVWLPTAGAALFIVADWDDNVSDWAIDHHPLSDDAKDADDLSDDLRSFTTAAYVASSLLLPSGDNMREVAWNKSKAMGVGLLAIGLNDGITEGLKSLNDRERPDKTGSDSFPSKHASEASVRATLAARNLDYINMNTNLRRGLQGTVYTAAGLTGWARIEAAKHYPSDVLFGYALGHFIGAVVNDVFITPASQGDVMISVTPEQSGLRLHVHARF